MIPPFEFATAGQIIFGSGKRTEAIEAVRRLGSKPALITGSSPERAAWFGRAMTISLTGEPTVDDARDAADAVRDAGCDVVVGIGGGSVIDLAKAIAALATNQGDVLDYLEVIGLGQPLENDPLPVVAVPTTAGTGSEVTRNAVLTSTEDHVKASLRHAKMIPRVAVIDPELTLTLPRDVTAYTGLDALTQLIEPSVSTRANPFTGALCREAIPRAIAALRTLARNLEELEARSEMSFASLCGGIALANSGLGAVHGLAAPIGGMTKAPHGAICARLLPLVIEANQHGMEWLDAARELVSAFEVPGLAYWGVEPDHIHELSVRAMASSSMKTNPVKFSEDELQAILTRAL